MTPPIAWNCSRRPCSAAALAAMIADAMTTIEEWPSEKKNLTA